MSKHEPHLGDYILHQGDCLEYMQELEDEVVDCVITDPPYPNLKGGVSIGHAVLAPVRHVTRSIGDPWKASWNWLGEAWRICKYGMIVFCSYASVDSLGIRLRDLGADLQNLGVWYKRNSVPPLITFHTYKLNFLGWQKSTLALHGKTSVPSMIFQVYKPVLLPLRGYWVKEAKLHTPLKSQSNS